MSVPVNPAVVLAIDPGTKSGYFLLGPSYLDVRMHGETTEDDAMVRLGVCKVALRLARSERLPLLFAREKWTAGGDNATPSMMAGLGARWGWWGESMRIAKKLFDDEESKRSTLAFDLKIATANVYTQTWWARAIGGRKPKSKQALAVCQTAMGRLYRGRLTGGFGESLGPDEAVAGAVGFWAQTSPDAAKNLPASAWLAEGNWIPRVT